MTSSGHCAEHDDSFSTLFYDDDFWVSDHRAPTRPSNNSLSALDVDVDYGCGLWILEYVDFGCGLLMWIMDVDYGCGCIWRKLGKVLLFMCVI